MVRVRAHILGRAVWVSSIFGWRPRYYAFFPLDIEKMFRPDIPFMPLWPKSVMDAK
jgi:hypothetical protein